MNKQVRILPGTPDDANREYLPERIKTTDIVVNENGNNSIVYPEHLQEFHGVVADGLEDEWYEYVPESYDPSRPVPLVIGLHGGLMTGWGHAIYTSWTLVADREGFICLFPNAHEKRMWTVEGVFETFRQEDAPDLPIVLPPENMDDNHDIKMIQALIARMEEKYNIDKGRIFMQGMSMGNIMTGQFARNYGRILAGAAGSGGPCEPFNLYDESGKIKNKAGHMAIWQSRPEKNGLPPGKSYDEFYVNKWNRIYWMRINECDPVPQIKIIGEDNFAFYKGSQGNNVLMDVKNRDHGQTFDDAELVWDYLFSGCYKDESGRLHHSEPRKKWCVDEVNFAVAKDRRKAWVNNGIMEIHIPCFFWEKIKYHGLNGNAIVRGSYAYIPVSSLAEIFHMRLKTEENGRVAYLCGAPQIGKIISEEVEEIQFAEGNIACIVNNSVESMYAEAVMKENELCVSLEWFARRFLRLSVSECDGVVYATDHPSRISWHMADLIRTYLT